MTGRKRKRHTGPNVSDAPTPEVARARRIIAASGLMDLSIEARRSLELLIDETLEFRVGSLLAEEMTDEQLDEFEAFIDADDEEGALEWLNENFPNHKFVVRDVVEALVVELQLMAPTVRKTVAVKVEG